MSTLDPKFEFHPHQVLSHVLRVLWYVVAQVAVVLLAATVSPRFVAADEAWVFFVPGAVIGVLAAAIGSALRYPPAFPIPLPIVVFLLMLISIVLACNLVGLVLGRIDLGVAGSLVIGTVGALAGLFLYFVFDAPDPVTDV